MTECFYFQFINFFFITAQPANAAKGIGYKLLRDFLRIWPFYPNLYPNKPKIVCYTKSINTLTTSYRFIWALHDPTQPSTSCDVFMETILFLQYRNHGP